MEMKEFVDMLAAIRDDKKVLIPYQLHSEGQLRNIIHSLGSPLEAFDYFEKIWKAEPATIDKKHNG